MGVKIKFVKTKFYCYLGYWMWHALIKKHPEIQNTAVIILPTKRDSYSYYSLLYLDQFLEKSNRDNAVILTFDKKVIQTARDFSSNIVSIIPVTRRKMKYILTYASLYEFDNRLIIASLEEPVGRNGRNLIGIKGLTEEEIFVIGVYRIFPFVKLQHKPWFDNTYEENYYCGQK